MLLIRRYYLHLELIGLYCFLEEVFSSGMDWYSLADDDVLIGSDGSG